MMTLLQNKITFRETFSFYSWATKIDDKDSFGVFAPLNRLNMESGELFAWPPAHLFVFGEKFYYGYCSIVRIMNMLNIYVFLSVFCGSLYHKVRSIGMIR